MIEGLEEHKLYPLVDKMSPPRTLAGRVLSSTRDSAFQEAPVDHMAAVRRNVVDFVHSATEYVYLSGVESWARGQGRGRYPGCVGMMM